MNKTPAENFSGGFICKTDLPKRFCLLAPNLNAIEAGF